MGIRTGVEVEVVTEMVVVGMCTCMEEVVMVMVEVVAGMHTRMEEVVKVMVEAGAEICTHMVEAVTVMVAAVMCIHMVEVVMVMAAEVMNTHKLVVVVKVLAVGVGVMNTRTEVEVVVAVGSNVVALECRLVGEGSWLDREVGSSQLEGEGKQYARWVADSILELVVEVEVNMVAAAAVVKDLVGEVREVVVAVNVLACRLGEVADEFLEKLHELVVVDAQVRKLALEEKVADEFPENFHELVEVEDAIS